MGPAIIFEESAEVAQLVEHQFPKLEVAGSRPVFRSFLLEGDDQDCAASNKSRSVYFIPKRFAIGAFVTQPL